jgi:hypothetical protein
MPIPAAAITITATITTTNLVIPLPDLPDGGVLLGSEDTIIEYVNLNT